MSTSSRTLALVAYLLSLPGALVVLLTQRRDPFASFHARQSLVVALAMLLTPLGWVALGWALAWVPLIGPALALALFALVLAAELGFLFSWVMGMVYALQGRAKLVPLVGRWAAPRAARRVAPAPPLAVEA